VIFAAAHNERGAESRPNPALNLKKIILQTEWFEAAR
jgi:hypothetical protein